MTTVPVGDQSVESARARVGTWPHEPDVAQIVLLDHHSVPTLDAVRTWILQADRSHPRRIRTGALFPPAAAAFLDAGFEVIDRLALLEIDLAARPGEPRRRAVRTPGIAIRRMRSGHLAEVATLDRLAFGDPWGNDEQSLREITAATPHHRARVVIDDARIDGFAISGLSARCGYLQRLAVHPDAVRRGIASELVGDALRWMRRRGADRALVNTAIDNAAALSLYGGFGFVRRPETLAILELTRT